MDNFRACARQKCKSKHMKQKTNEDILMQMKADLISSVLFSSARCLQFCTLDLVGKYSSTSRNLSHDKFSKATPKIVAHKANSNRHTVNRHAGESYCGPQMEGESAAAMRLALSVPLRMDRWAFRVENHRGFVVWET